LTRGNQKMVFKSKYDGIYFSRLRLNTNLRISIVTVNT